MARGAYHLPIWRAATVGARVGRVRDRASRVGRRLRVRGGPLRVVRNTIDGFFSQAGTRMAAALSYYSILVAGPTLVLTLWLGSLAFGEEPTREAVAQIVSRAMPPNSGATAALADEMVRTSTATASLAALTGLGALFGFTRALATSLNVMMNAEGREPLYRTAVVAPLLLLAVFGLLWGAWALEIALDVVTYATGISEESPIGRALSAPVPFALGTVFFAIIFRVVPRVRLSYLEILLPSALGAGLWESSRQLFGWLVGSESSYMEVFGPLGGIVALLSWVYLSSAILVVTGQFAWAFAMERRGRGRLAAEQPREAGLSGRIEPLHGDTMVNEGASL